MQLTVDATVLPKIREGVRGLLCGTIKGDNVFILLASPVPPEQSSSSSGSSSVGWRREHVRQVKSMLVGGLAVVGTFSTERGSYSKDVGVRFAVVCGEGGKIEGWENQTPVRVAVVELGRGTFRTLSCSVALGVVCAIEPGEQPDSVLRKLSAEFAKVVDGLHACRWIVAGGPTSEEPGRLAETLPPRAEVKFFSQEHPLARKGVDGGGRLVVSCAGSVKGICVAHAGCTIGEAVAALVADVGNTLSTRCELIEDDAKEMLASGDQEKSVSLPARTAISLQSGAMVTDHFTSSETVQDVQDRVQSILGIKREEIEAGLEPLDVQRTQPTMGTSRHFLSIPCVVASAVAITAVVTGASFLWLI